MKSVVISLALLSSLFVAGCSSGPAVQQQKYAKLKDTRTFENEFPAVWKAIEETFRNYKVLERDPEDVSPVELRKLRKRTLETDWINAQSRDKYITFKVNDLPQKKYLWTRVKYKIIAETVLGGVQVKVETSEEIERLNDDGSSAGYEKASDIDTSRPNEVLDKIANAILAAPPIENNNTP